MVKETENASVEEEKLRSVGGWPAHLNRYPERPQFFPFDDLSAPHVIHEEQLKIFDETKNIYAVLHAITEFHALGLYPPVWALDAIANCIDKHLKAPSPELLATQFGVSARGSGNKRYQQYEILVSYDKWLTEMFMLLGGFDVTTNFAAKAIIKKYDLSITIKSLVNRFTETFGTSKQFQMKNRSYEYDPFFEAENREAYIQKFPPEIRKKLRRHSPTKT